MTVGNASCFLPSLCGDVAWRAKYLTLTGKERTLTVGAFSTLALLNIKPRPKAVS